jgi:hypothetical protein
MYNYKNIDEMLKQAKAILEKAPFNYLSNESFNNLMKRGYGDKETAFNDIKNLVQQVEFAQDSDAGLTFNIKGNMLIVEKDTGISQLWRNPEENVDEEVGQHLLYPAIEIEFNTGERNKIYFSKINITNNYIPINQFSIETHDPDLKFVNPDKPKKQFKQYM